MMNDDKRSRLVAKLLRMTQQGDLEWQPHDGLLKLPLVNNFVYSDIEAFGESFFVIASDLKFVLGFSCNLPRSRGVSFPFLPFIDSGAVMNVFDGSQTTMNPIDAFTENDRLPILRSLYDMVYRSVNKIDPNNTKIDAFLTNDVTHAQ